MVLKTQIIITLKLKCCSTKLLILRSAEEKNNLFSIMHLNRNQGVSDASVKLCIANSTAAGGSALIVL